MSNLKDPSTRQSIFGTWFAVLAFFTWGILPLFWKLLASVSPFEIVAHRVVWTCLFSGLLILLLGKWQLVKGVFRNKGVLRGVIFSALLLAVNWLIFIYAVNSNQVLDASLGYYINPLFSVFLGLIVLKEQVNMWQKLAIFLAFIGVFIVTFQYGRLPWIALSLAVTFAIYGLIKKTSHVDPIVGLTMETLFMLPCALILLVFMLQGQGHWLKGSAHTSLYLTATGAITAIPLLLFTAAAQRIPLSKVGFIQYLTPTCFFILARFAYHEPFSFWQLISFIFIWTALAVYSLSEYFTKK